jgi:hypothetical protein
MRAAASGVSGVITHGSPELVYGSVPLSADSSA